MTNLEVAIKTLLRYVSFNLTIRLSFFRFSKSQWKIYDAAQSFITFTERIVQSGCEKKVLWLDLRSGFLFLCVLARYISDEHSGAQINRKSHAPIHISNYHVRGLCTRLFVRTRFVYFEHVLSFLSTYSTFNRFFLKLDKRILVSEISNAMCCAQFN